MRTLLLGLFLLPTAALGQLVAVPQASTASAQTAGLSWSSATPGTGQVACSATNPCTVAVYRCPGAAAACPATGTVWTLVTTTAAGATGYTDNPGAGTWSYLVEPTLVSDGLNQGPSDVATVTLVNPLIPAPLTLTATAGSSSGAAAQAQKAARPAATPKTSNSRLLK